MTFPLSILFLVAFIPAGHATGAGMEYIGYGISTVITLLFYVIYKIATFRRGKASVQPAGKKGFDHTEHFGLVLLTIGLWTPIWLLACIIYKIRNAISKTPDKSP